MSDNSIISKNESHTQDEKSQLPEDSKKVVSNQHSNSTISNSPVVNPSTKSFGIRRIEVLSEQYKPWYLRLTLFISIFFVAYCYGLDGTIRSTFQTYATSSYSTHSLLSTVNVIRAVAAAAAQPTFARLSDKFGRLELLIVGIVFYAIGTVIESQAYDVNRFAGGAVLYQIGYTGVIFLLQAILADFSNLNWRLTCSFIPALPFIINTWVSGDIASDLLAKHSWNYSIGIWAFIFPLSCVPLILCFIHMILLARRTDEWKLIKQEEKIHNSKSIKSWKNNILIDLFWELDVIGIILIIVVFGLFLTPFTLAGGVHSEWKKAKYIVPLVIGFCSIPLLVIWEAKGARFPVLPWALMKDRGVWSALFIGLMIDFVWYMPNDYMYTVLIVGMNASVKAATRITSLYSFVSVITGPLVGLLVAVLRRVKGFIHFGVCMWIVSLGLLLHFRGDNNGTDSQYYLNGVIGALCLFGFGAGFFTYATQVSIASVTSHEWMALILSLYLSSYNIGSAFGSALSGAIWTNKMYGYMVENFNDKGLNVTLATEAYSSPYTFILTNTWGSEERVAVVLAYAKTQRILCIIGLCLCFPLLLSTFFLRDHKLESVQSLELAHHNDSKEGVVKGEGGEIDGAVVVNKYDDDYIVMGMKKLFKRNK